MEKFEDNKYLIGVVGPSGSGKSTLITGLEERGHTCRHIAQDHSYVPDMWKQMTDPDLLIYLEVSHSVSLARRPSNWTEEDHLEEARRLSDAREHADLIIDTDELTPEQVLNKAIKFLQEHP